MGEEYKILLASCDTYRAAASKQLEVWSQRGEGDVFGPEEYMRGKGKMEWTDEELGKIGPSTVLYGALEKAKEVRRGFGGEGGRWKVVYILFN